MSDQYNLDENVREYFEFTLNGKDYRCLYPTMEEVDKSQGLNKKESDDWLYTFIKPIGDAPPIQEARKKMNLQKLNNFSKMIDVEFGRLE